MIDTEVNPQADFSTGKSQSVVAHRTHVKIAPKYGGKFKENDIIRLEIPSTNYLDSEMTSLSFNGVLTNTQGGKILPEYWGAAGPQDGSFGRFPNAIQRIFNRVKLLQGSNVIEDIQDYGTLFKLITVATAPVSWRDTTGVALEGYGDFEKFDTKRALKSHGSRTGTTAPGGIDGGSDHGHRYQVQLNLGLLARSGKYLPLKYTGQFTIELYMERDSECTISSVGAGSDDFGRFAAEVLSDNVSYPNLSYYIDDVFLHCHFIVPIEEYDNNVLSQINSGGIDIHFDTYSSHTRQVNAGGRQTHSFQERAVSVRGGYAVMRNEFDIGDNRTDIRFASNKIKDFQWKLGSQYIPAQQVNCEHGAAEAYTELLESFGAYGDVLATGSVHSYNFAPGEHTFNAFDPRPLRQEGSLPFNFIMGLNLEKTLGQLSGFNTSVTNTDVELIMTLGAFETSHYRDLASTDGRAQYDNVRRTTLDTGGSPSSYELRGFQDCASDIPTMVPKDIPNFARLNFFAHIDSVFKINGPGSIEVLR